VSRALAAPREVIAQLAPGVQLVVAPASSSFCATTYVGEAYPSGQALANTIFELGEARVSTARISTTDGEQPTLWLGRTVYYLPWLELLRVADFLHIDIPLPHPPEGTAVQS
jgi:hypothetical protein